jgi:hypothetical protein
MAAQFIEAPLQIQKKYTIPTSIKNQCLQAGIPISGAAM